MTFLNQPKQLLKLKKQILIRLYVPKRFPSLSYHVKLALWETWKCDVMRPHHKTYFVKIFNVKN